MPFVCWSAGKEERAVKVLPDLVIGEVARWFVYQFVSQLIQWYFFFSLWIPRFYIKEAIQVCWRSNLSFVSVVNRPCGKTLAQ